MEVQSFIKYNQSNNKYLLNQSNVELYWLERRILKIEKIISKLCEEEWKLYSQYWKKKIDNISFDFASHAISIQIQENRIKVCGLLNTYSSNFKKNKQLRENLLNFWYDFTLLDRLREKLKFDYFLSFK